MCHMEGQVISNRIPAGVLRLSRPHMLVALLLLYPALLLGQSASLPQSSAEQSETSSPEELNLRLEELVQATAVGSAAANEYKIGPQDLLDITVFEAPEMNQQVRVSARGEISLPLLGPVKAAGLTPQQLELVLQELLRRSFMKDPHVGVFVRDMQSHPVSVFGAVKKPGVYQIAGSKTLIEVLSLAGGLEETSGDTVIVMRGAAFNGLGSSRLVTPAAEGDATMAAVEKDASDPFSGLEVAMASEVADTIEINLKELLETGDPRYNIVIHPGDIVKVTRAGVVYVVGAVHKPGGFVLQTNENISVLRALALAEGSLPTAAKGRSSIIRTMENGERNEIPIHLGKILAGKDPDPTLQPNDILFVPNSTGKTVALRGVEAVVRTVSGLIIFSGR